MTKGPGPSAATRSQPSGSSVVPGAVVSVMPTASMRPRGCGRPRRAVGSSGAAGSGAGPSRADATWATTTATITTGMTFRPSVPSNTVASSVEVSGRPSIAAHIAPMPMATAGTSERPGRSAAAMPAAAPMNSAGKTGPPRKLDSDRA